jgi:outer membrane biosynthesis protein TonB
MFFKIVLLLSVLLCATAYVYTQDSSQQPSKPVARLVTEKKCDFSEYAPLRLWNLPDSTIEKKVDAVYPKEAVDTKVEGKVVLIALIDRNGNVVETCVENGHPLLIQPTIEAVKQWKFKKNFGFAANRYKNRKYLQTGISITFSLRESENSKQ